MKDQVSTYLEMSLTGKDKNKTLMFKCHEQQNNPY